MFLYNHNLIHKKKPEGCQLISIGNITVGGTGKTPIVKLLAEEYKKRGLKIVIVSRGYKSSNFQSRIVSDGEKILLYKEEAGDEALMLSKILPDVPVVIGKDRYDAGRLAVREFSPDLILLDDAFQHWRLKRDKDIVLIDASNPFGYNHLIPRGLLREPLKSLARADLFLITKVNGISRDKIDKIKRTLKKYNSRAGIYTAEYKSMSVRLHISKNKSSKVLNKVVIEERSSDYLQGKKVTAFSGIGNPLSFERSLLDCGAEIINHHKFPDHHHYSLDDIDYICRSMDNEDIDLVITTKKDIVKIDDRMVKLIAEKTVLAELIVSMQISNKEDFIRESLNV